MRPRCPYCGAPIQREPDEVPAPADYCHEGDHAAIDGVDTLIVDGDEAEALWERSTRPGELLPLSRVPR